MEDEAGDIWIGTNGGLASYRDNQGAPVARIVEIQTDQSFTNLTALPMFPTGARLSVRFDSIDLKTISQKRQYRVRIVSGMKTAGELDTANDPREQQSWLSPTHDRQYSWLPTKPGTYTFAVQAIDRDLNCSQPATLVLTLSAPWYANAWVLYPGGSLIAALGLTALVASAKARRRKREARQLRERLFAEEQKAREAAESAAMALAAKNTRLEAARKEADEANQSKSQFLASMSHELRTPLNAIIGYSEMMHEELEEMGDKALVPDPQKIQAAAKHQLGLVNDILDLSKIEAGKMTLFVEEFDVAKLVREVTATVQPLVAKKANRLEVDCPADVGTMRSDQTKLRQMLFNLLSNACKCTTNGL